MYRSLFLLWGCFMVAAAMTTRNYQRSIVIPPTSMPSTSSGLTLTSSAMELTPSVTNHLLLNCTFSKLANPNIASLISLILSRWDKSSNSMKEILTITSLKPDQVQELQEVKGTVNGALDAKGDAFLSIAWNFPGHSVATKYSCEFHAFDIVGHTLEATVGVDIAINNIDFSAIGEQLRILKEWKADQVKLTNNLNNSQEDHNIVLREHEKINGNQSLIIDTLISAVNKQRNVIASQNNTIDGLTNFLVQQENVIATRNNTIDGLTNSLAKQENAIASQNNTIDGLTSSLARLEKVIASQNHTMDILSSSLKQQEQVNAAQDGIHKKQERTLQRLGNWALEHSDDNFNHVTLKTSNVVIDNQRMMWANNYLANNDAQMYCILKGGKLAEFPFEKLKAVHSQLKAAGMRDENYWVGLIREDANSSWIWASNGRDAGSVTWEYPPSHLCVTFGPAHSGYRSRSCGQLSTFILCSKPL